MLTGNVVNRLIPPLHILVLDTVYVLCIGLTLIPELLDLSLHLLYLVVVFQLKLFDSSLGETATICLL